MLLFYLLKRRISLNTLFKTLGAMFVNIPVGLLYAWLMVYFLSFARVTISNTSGKDLGPIRIEGCEQEEIEELKTGESKTLWIKIPGDCSIEIQYEMENTSQRDTLVKYITPGGGLKVNYELTSGQ
jgi:hypothetical protein